MDGAVLGITFTGLDGAQVSVTGFIKGSKTTDG